MEVMVDIETMSSNPTAAVCSVGAVAFDPLGRDAQGRPRGAAGNRFYMAAELDGQERLGFELSGSTVKFWMSQPPAAQAALFKDARPLQHVLAAFASFLRQELGDAGGLWANGPDFDNVVLAQAYARLNIPPPWKWHQNRCFRTLRALADPARVKPPAPAGTRHHALDDAVWQAEYAMAIMHSLREPPDDRRAPDPEPFEELNAKRMRDAVDAAKGRKRR